MYLCPIKIIRSFPPHCNTGIICLSIGPALCKTGYKRKGKSLCVHICPFLKHNCFVHSVNIQRQRHSHSGESNCWARSLSVRLWPSFPCKTLNIGKRLPMQASGGWRIRWEARCISQILLYVYFHESVNHISENCVIFPCKRQKIGKRLGSAGRHT